MKVESDCGETGLQDAAREAGCGGWRLPDLARPALQASDQGCAPHGRAPAGGAAAGAARSGTAACCAALAHARQRGSALPFATYACQDGELDGVERLQADWVFGYGSLIWDPGFPFEERHLVRVNGYHRKYCIRSTRYRGTDRDPGIVLGLDRGGSCQGLAFRFEPALRDECIELLYHREMTSLSYEAVLLDVALADGREVRALTFVASHGSSAYESLGRDEVLRRLARCTGSRGRNRDYAVNTWLALKEWGIEDTELASIAQALDSGRLTP